jgi:hypothetical protein
LLEEEFQEAIQRFEEMNYKITYVPDKHLFLEHKEKDNEIKIYFNSPKTFTIKGVFSMSEYITMHLLFYSIKWLGYE